MSAEGTGVEWKLRAERSVARSFHENTSGRSGFYDIFYLYFKHYSIIFAYTRLLTYILNNPGESRGFWVNFRSKVTGSQKHQARTPLGH